MSEMVIGNNAYFEGVFSGLWVLKILQVVTIVQFLLRVMGFISAQTDCQDHDITIEPHGVCQIRAVLIRFCYKCIQLDYRLACEYVKILPRSWDVVICDIANFLSR